MIDASQVAPIVVTRGDVSLTQVLEPFHGRGFADGYVWNNGGGDADLSVYGRYAAIDRVTAPAILVVDDDVALSQQALDGLLAAYQPGRIVANMPPEYRGRYTDSCLVGFGAIFDRDLPAKAFAPYWHDTHGVEFGPLDPSIHLLGEPFELEVINEVMRAFHRTCDIVFTTLTPFLFVDLPFEYLPWTRAPNRMYLQSGNSEERRRMLELCRRVRNAR